MHIVPHQSLACGLSSNPKSLSHTHIFPDPLLVTPLPKRKLLRVVVGELLAGQLPFLSPIHKVQKNPGFLKSPTHSF